MLLTSRIRAKHFYQCCAQARQHDRNFILLQMTVQLANVDCRAVLYLLKGQNFYRDVLLLSSGRNKTKWSQINYYFKMDFLWMAPKKVQYK